MRRDTHIKMQLLITALRPIINIFSLTLVGTSSHLLPVSEPALQLLQGLHIRGSQLATQFQALPLLQLHHRLSKLAQPSLGCLSLLVKHFELDKGPEHNVCAEVMQGHLPLFRSPKDQCGIGVLLLLLLQLLTGPVRHTC